MTTFWATLRLVLLVLFALGLGGWFVWGRMQRSENPLLILAKVIISLVLIGIVVKVVIPFLFKGQVNVIFGMLGVAALAVVFGLIWAPSIGRLLVQPLMDLFTGGNLPPDPKPFYSMAQTKRNKGLPREAMVEVQKQLELFPHDATGMLLLAEIQATDLQDVTAAADTIQRFLAQPNHSAVVCSHALLQLADWQLQAQPDGEVARVTLEKILSDYPQSTYAYTATQRLSNLANVCQLIQEAKDRPTLALPTHLGRHPGEIPAKAAVNPNEIAAALVAQLQRFPLDMEARERLATVYAEECGRLDLGLMELEHLLAQARQPVRLQVHWLNLMADWQIRLGNNEERAKAVLQRIITLFPTHPGAEMARQRMARVKNELKQNEKSQAIKLGSYEKDLGLKWNAPNAKP